MNRTMLAGTFLMVAFLASMSGGAESKPNFSGTWTMDASRSESPHFTESKGNEVEVIQQSDTELVLETRKDGQSETMVFKMDGSETEKPAPDNGPYKWSLKWDGSNLVTEIARNINRSTITIRQTRSLDAGGKEMTVNRTLTVQHGYNGSIAKNYSAAKDIFVRDPKK